MMTRNFQAGDETAQVAIYNEATAQLPKFKPATLDEVRRRCRAPEFDPQTRFFAIDNEQPVGYAPRSCHHARAAEGCSGDLQFGSPGFSRAQSRRLGTAPLSERVFSARIGLCRPRQG